MNIPEIEKQVLPYLIKFAESPPVQAEIEAAKAAIISIIESQSLSISKRIIRWIRNKIKRGNVKMTTTITVKNSEGTVLAGATISYVVSAVTVDGTTDTAGQLAISDLEAGTYTFTATLDGYTSASVDVTVTSDADTTGTIVLTTETTEEEATLSTITDSMKDAAETAATTVANELLSELTKTGEDGQSLIEKGLAEVQRLTKEIGTTKDWFVKIRNSAEVVVLTGLLAAAGAGVTAAISELKDKLK